MPRGTGTYCGVACGWQKAIQVDESALRLVFADIRSEAVMVGCSHYPSRDDLAANETLFQQVIDLYMKKTDNRQDVGQHRAEFRRWILMVYKAGGTPNN